MRGAAVARAEAFSRPPTRENLETGKSRRQWTDVLPRLEAGICSGPAPADLADLFPHPRHRRPPREYGFGGGEHLVLSTAGDPETGFIGVEPFVQRHGQADSPSLIAGFGTKTYRLHVRRLRRCCFDWPAIRIDRGSIFLFLFLSTLDSLAEGRAMEAPLR